MRITTKPKTKSVKAVRSAVSSEKADAEPCPHCVDGRESYRYFGGAYIFDVDKARRIVQDGRDSIELSPDDVTYSVDMSRIYPQHLPHVDTKYPGIIAHVWGPGEGGEWLHGHLLIDGHHRAARCLQLQQPFFVYVLTESESEAILIRGVGSRRPKLRRKTKSSSRQSQRRSKASAKRSLKSRRRTAAK